MASTTSKRERVERGIYKRATKDGREVYEVVYRDSDRRLRWEKVQGGILAARQRRNEIAVAKGRGEKVRPNPRLRFGDAATTWWADKAIKLRPNTQSAYGASLKHLRMRFDPQRLDEIDVTGVAKFITAQQDAGLKAWTIRGQLVVLGRVFDHAARHMGWHGQNPVRQLDPDERPLPDEREPRILDSDELRRLIDAVEDRHRLIYKFAAATGARLGEVCGLRWHAVDFSAGTVYLSHQLDRRGEYVELKTRRSRRTIEIPPTLVSELRMHKLASDHSDAHDYVFCSETGTGRDHRNVGGRILARAVKRAGLGDEEHNGVVVKQAPTFHSLRHSHGSALIAAGWDLEEVSARLGHRDVTVTARTYVHAYESAKRSAARSERLEAMYGGPSNAVLTPDGSKGQETATASGAEVRELRQAAANGSEQQ